MSDIVERVRKDGVAMEHDISFWSGFMGQPEIYHNEWVGYYDGRQLLLYGGALLDDHAINGTQLKQIVNRYEGIASRIECWLPGPVPNVVCSRWSKRISKEGSIALGIHKEDFGIGLRNRARRLRQAERNGIVLQKITSGFLNAGHYNLIRTFFQDKTLQGYDFPYSTYVHYFLQPSSRGFTIEAVCKGVPCALATFSTALERRLIFMHLFIDRSEQYNGASDLIYEYAIRHCEREKIEVLDLGYSFTKGLIHYKEEWGARTIKPPIQQITFERPKEEFGPFYNWPFEMVFSYDNR